MLNPFACARFRFVLEARTPLHLSAFAGATLRGGFGHAFKRSVCLWQPGDCPRCLLRHRCVYPYVFETAPPPGGEKLRGISQIPRPYVIEANAGVAQTVAVGERCEFALVLIGRAIDDFPYFIRAFADLGEAGLGADGGRFVVAEVHAEGPGRAACVYTAADGLRDADWQRVTAAAVVADPRAAPAGRRLAVEFLTPTRIRSDGAMCSEPTFQDLARALLRRLSSLCYFHCGGELDVDFRGLIDRAATVAVAGARVHWQRQGRFSGRQHRGIDMSGLVGRVDFEAAAPQDWSPFLPLLLAGEWAHVGKGTVMGLGQYRVGM
jgi:hypothetical protein